MADQLSLRGGTTAEHATFTGANKEVTVDTTKKTLVVNDGATVGGHPLMRENASNSALALGSASTPSLKWDANTGIYSPGADQLAVATNGVGRLFVDAGGRVGIGGFSDFAEFQISGSAPSLYFKPSTDSETSEVGFRNAGNTQTRGFIAYDHSDESLRFRVNLSEKLRITSAGLVGIGTSAPGALLDLRQPTSASEQEHLRIVGGQRSSDGFAVGVRILTGAVSSNSNRHLRIINSGNTIFQHYETSSNTPVPDRHILLCPDGGNVGIGVTSPGSLLHLAATGTSTNAEIIIAGTNTNGDASCQARIGATQDGALTSAALTFSTRLSGTNSEKARLDSSGRLLIGTSTSRTVGGSVQSNLQIEGTGTGTSTPSCSVTQNSNSFAGPRFALAKSRGTANGSVTIVQINDDLGTIDFAGADGTDASSTAARISAQVDGTPGVNDMPGRIVLATTADGASSPTERLRINSVGQTMVNSAGTAAAPVISKVDDTNTGIFFPAADTIAFAEGGAEAARIDSSGRLLVGTSSVSGLAAAKTVVVETTAAAVQRLIGNTAAQGSAQKITVVRYYPIISLGTKLIIPFVSQVSANTVTLCKVTGLRNQFNSNSPLPFEINFAVGHTNALFNLSSYGGQGNFASIAASGLNVEITFTTAYAAGGIIVCIEYMASSPLSSIDVPNIAMN
jgi:hypothetical protein